MGKFLIPGEEATLVVLVLTVIISSVLAQEQSVTINKPKTRLTNPWEPLKPDHVRCFCNLPTCVSTSYMCKSSSGGCYSEVDSMEEPGYRVNHGCIEYLNEPDCLLNTEEIVQKNEEPKRLLVCCTNDLCNHIDNPLTRKLINKSLEESEKKVQQHQHPEIYLYSDSEVWFRAATIAVPICGAVILFVLIALAVKILKNENRNSLHHKLGPAMYVVPAHHKDDKWSSTPYKPCTVKLPYYQPQTHPNAFRLVREDRPQFNIQQFQMPLLGTSSETGSRVVTPVPPVGVSKNDTNAKINLLQCESNSSKSIILELGKSTPDYSLGVNLNSEDKFCKDDEKTFLS